jgi:hypothetical protein
MFKIGLLSVFLILPTTAQAHFSCAGETYTGIIVQVDITTVGTMGYVKGGEVTITEKDGATRGYQLKEDEIPQAFESIDGEPERAIVGLGAYVNYDYPVQIRYVGKNFEEDLVKVLRTPGRKKQAGNAMRVWKGPGFAGGEQHSFADVVCTVTLDP